MISLAAAEQQACVRLPSAVPAETQTAAARCHRPARPFPLEDYRCSWKTPYPANTTITEWKRTCDQLVLNVAAWNSRPCDMPCPHHTRTHASVWFHYGSLPIHQGQQKCHEREASWLQHRLVAGCSQEWLCWWSSGSLKKQKRGAGEVWKHHIQHHTSHSTHTHDAREWK